MKKYLLLLLIPFFALSCDTQSGNEVIVLTSISINDIDKELNVGDTYQLSIKTEPEASVTPKWTSSNEEVASVSKSGLLTVLADGFTNITATVGTLSASKTATINKVQDFTSFVFVHSDDITYNNSVVGYYTEDGLCHKVAKLGDLAQNAYSSEITVTDDSIKELYFFCDNYGGIRLKQVFEIRQSRKNIFKIEDMGSDRIGDKDDPTQYPQ